MAKRDKRRRRKTPANGTFDNPPVHSPTPEEIRERCWEIQDEWDPDEEHKRRAWADAPVLVPGTHREAAEPTLEDVRMG